MRRNAEETATSTFSWQVEEFIKYYGYMPPGVEEVVEDPDYPDYKSYRLVGRGLPVDEVDPKLIPLGSEEPLQATLYEAIEDNIVQLPNPEEFSYYCPPLFVLDGTEQDVPVELGRLVSQRAIALERAQEEWKKAEQLARTREYAQEVCRILGINPDDPH